MKDFIKRLTSRKFLLTVAAALTLYANKQYTELAAVVLGYIGVEGYGDAQARVATEKTAQVKAGFDSFHQTGDPDDIVDGADGTDRVITPGGM